MRRILLCLTSLMTAICMTACTSASSEERTGQAEGYGGTLTVRVTTDGGKITNVEVTEHHETEGVGTRAIDALPQAMVTANSWQVDSVSGATVTSKAIMAAVADAMGQTILTDATEDGAQSTSAPQTFLPEGAKAGIGMAATGRVGPGKDDQENPVYSFNVVFAHGIFDAEGRVLRMDVDQLEVATPNYDGASMPQFSGFPGQGGYALWDDAARKVNGTTSDTEENFLSEVSAWVTKRGRGENYKMGTGTWSSQMDAYQQMFVGKTVDEIEDWFGKYFSGANGRPLKEESTAEGDLQQDEGLADADKQELADITSSATMSLRDSHGDILLAVRRAWENAQ